MVISESILDFFFFFSNAEYFLSIHVVHILVIFNHSVIPHCANIA